MSHTSVAAVCSGGSDGGWESHVSESRRTARLTKTALFRTVFCLWFIYPGGFQKKQNNNKQENKIIGSSGPQYERPTMLHRHTWLKRKLGREL